MQPTPSTSWPATWSAPPGFPNEEAARVLASLSAALEELERPDGSGPAPPDEELRERVEWLVRWGHPGACCGLGQLYVEGHRIKADAREGLHLLWQALRHGEQQAAQVLSMVYGGPLVESAAGWSTRADRYLTLGRQQGLGADLQLTAALLTIGGAGDDHLVQSAYVRGALERLPAGLQRPTPEEAWRTLQDHREPR